jgi:capsid protein
MVAFRARVEQAQYHSLIPQLLTPIWERVITTAALDSELSLDAESLSVEWFAPPIAHVDPAKESDAEATLIAAGLKSRRQSVAERGYDIEDLDSEIAADREREATLGLAFGAKPQTKESENAQAA